MTRPSLTACPPPPATIADWVIAGWQEVDGSADVHASRNLPGKDGRAVIERFEDVSTRPSILRQWLGVRREWQTNERPARQALAIFQSVYEWYGIHQREAERIEILAGDGLLNCPDEGGRFNHEKTFQPRREMRMRDCQSDTKRRVPQ